MLARSGLANHGQWQGPRPVARPNSPPAEAGARIDTRIDGKLAILRPRGGSQMALVNSFHEVGRIRTLGIAVALAACLPAVAHASPARPPITGVSHIAVYAASPAASQHFYAHDLDATPGPDPEDPRGMRYYFAPTQFVEVL